MSIRGLAIQEVLLSEITGSAFNLRSETRDGDVDLLESIKTHGLMQPILVRPSKMKGYEIVAGNRRHEVFKTLGRRTIPAIIQELDDKTAFEITLTENIQRRNMEPIEEARAFRDYLDRYKWGSISELSDRINRRASFIVDRLKLIELPAQVQRFVEREKISPSHAEELSKLETPEQKVEVAKAVIQEQFTRDQTAEVVDLVKKRDMSVERAVQTVQVMERAKVTATQVAESLKEAIIESGKEIEKMKGSEQRKLMENYMLLGTIVQALNDGKIFCAKHPDDESMLKWPCGISVVETYESLRKKMNMR